MVINHHTMLRRIKMLNCKIDENSLNKMMINSSESEIKDIKRFWGDLEWYEREYLINTAIGNAESSIKPIFSAKIPNDIKKRYETAVENLNKLKALNDKEKPSKISLKILKFKAKIDLISQGVKNNTGPNLRECIAAISNLSDKERAKLDKDLDIEDIVKQGRAHSKSYEEIYETLFLEPNYTSQTKFIMLSKHIEKRFHFK
jgi:hypothetical protein